jgi:transposase
MTISPQDNQDQTPDRSVAGAEVPEKATRRKFNTAYKLRILKEADGCVERGALGKLLRREGLYSSQLRTWCKQRDAGTLAGLAPRKRGRKAERKDPVAEENERLKRENERLALRLKQAETIIDVQKKVSEILGVTLPKTNGGND